MRLVTSGEPDAEGRLLGVLDVQLAPGWKTYWRDPGASGVPPTIDVSTSRNVRSAELEFPAPERHDPGNFSWAGYSRPVSLPVTFQFETPGKPASVDATIFLGICETICVPVKASLVLDPTSDPDNPADVTLVASAHAALPARRIRASASGRSAPKLENSSSRRPIPAVPKERISSSRRTAATSSRNRTDLQKDGRTFFTINATRPATKPASGDGLHYTLVTGNGAVSGILPYF